MIVSHCQLFVSSLGVFVLKVFGQFGLPSSVESLGHILALETLARCLRHLLRCLCSVVMLEMYDTFKFI